MRALCSCDEALRASELHERPMLIANVYVSEGRDAQRLHAFQVRRCCS